jgi:Tol biopolymer transport system component
MRSGRALGSRHGANLYVVRPDGRGLTKILTSNEGRAGGTIIAQGYDPAWSPDGTTLVGRSPSRTRRA